MSKEKKMKEELTILTKDQARSLVTKINASMNDARTMLLELYEKEGWRVLGYSSWRECAQSEFQKSESYLYRQLNAAKVERNLLAGDDNLSTIVEKTIPEGQMQPLSRLKEQCHQRDAWRLANEIAESLERPVTAKDVEVAVCEIEEGIEEIKARDANYKPRKKTTSIPMFGMQLESFCINAIHHIPKVMKRLDPEKIDNRVALKNVLFLLQEATKTAIEKL